MSAFDPKRTFRHRDFDLDQIQGRRARTIVNNGLAFCETGVAEARGQEAMRKKARFSSLPTATGAIARAAYARALEARLEVGPLLKSSNLTTHQINNSHFRIPVKNQIQFLSVIADRLPDPFLGIHLAENIELREMGLPYYVITSSETLGDALRSWRGIAASRMREFASHATRGKT